MCSEQNNILNSLLFLQQYFCLEKSVGGEFKIESVVEEMSEASPTTSPLKSMRPSNTEMETRLMNDKTLQKTPDPPRKTKKTSLPKKKRDKTPVSKKKTIQKVSPTRVQPRRNSIPKASTPVAVQPTKAQIIGPQLPQQDAVMGDETADKKRKFSPDRKADPFAPGEAWNNPETGELEFST